jgi:hypothetical protein
METRETTLGQVLFPAEHGMPDEVWSKIAANGAVQSLFAAFPPQLLDPVKTEVKNSIGQLFQMTFLDILNGAWANYTLISKSLDESKQKPNEIILKPVVEHTVKSTHHPYVELNWGDRPIGKIQFELTATLKVEGLTLKIKNGQLLEIMTGTCQANLQLTYAGDVLTQAQTGRIALPGSFVTTRGSLLAAQAGTPAPIGIVPGASDGASSTSRPGVAPGQAPLQPQVKALLADLQSDQAKHRWNTIRQLSQMQVDSEIVVAALAKLAYDDPVQYVRDEAKSALQTPIYQAVLRRSNPPDSIGTPFAR